MFQQRVVLCRPAGLLFRRRSNAAQGPTIGHIAGSFAQGLQASCISSISLSAIKSIKQLDKVLLCSWPCRPSRFSISCTDCVMRTIYKYVGEISKTAWPVSLGRREYYIWSLSTTLSFAWCVHNSRVCGYGGRWNKYSQTKNIAPGKYAAQIHIRT